MSVQLHLEILKYCRLSCQHASCTHSHAQSSTTIIISFLTIQCICLPALCVSYCTQAGLLAVLEMWEMLLIITRVEGRSLMW